VSQYLNDLAGHDLSRIWLHDPLLPPLLFSLQCDCVQWLIMPDSAEERRTFIIDDYLILKAVMAVNERSIISWQCAITMQQWQLVDRNGESNG